MSAGIPDFGEVPSPYTSIKKEMIQMAGAFPDTPQRPDYQAPTSEPKATPNYAIFPLLMFFIVGGLCVLGAYHYELDVFGAWVPWFLGFFLGGSAMTGAAQMGHWTRH